MDGSGYALSLHGIHVVGISEADAIRQWRCLARTTLGGWDTPTDDPALRAAQIDWASWIMGQKHQPPYRALIQATRIIRALSNNAILLDHARELTARHALPT